MKTMATVAAALALATGLVTTAGAASTSAAGVNEPSRVLVVGDSVTQGRDGDFTWRYFAWRALQQQDVSVEFVGNRTGTNVAGGHNWDGSYADPDFDQDHAARWGMSMTEMLHNSSDVAPTIGSLVAAHDPDVIVETLGINDLSYVYGNAENFAGEVRLFVAEARAAKADVDVVLGALPQTWVGDVPDYNALLPTLATELSTPESRVVATPVAQWVNGVDTYDPVHPTTSGQEKLAAVVTGTLGPFLVPPPPPPLPAPTPTPTPSQAPPTATSTPSQPAPTESVPTTQPPAQVEVPTAPRRVRAVAWGKRIVVTWRASAHAERYVAKCGTRGKSVTGTWTVVRSSAGWCNVRALNETGASPWRTAEVRR